MQRRSRTGVLMGVGLTAIALCAACSNDAQNPAPSVSAAPAPTQSSAPGDATTSTNPLTQADQELRAAEVAYFAAYNAAIAAPGDQQVVDRLLRLYVPGSAGANAIKTRMNGLASRGFAGRPGRGGYFIVERVDVSSAEEGARATVTICTFDDGVIYDTRHNGPDGKPIVVNDETQSGRTQSKYIRQNGEWRLLGGDVVQSWKGVNRCPPRGRDS